MRVLPRDTRRKASELRGACCQAGYLRSIDFFTPLDQQIPIKQKVYS
jgi:hypothetical protein